MENQAQRPWLRIYRGVSPTLKPACETALDMFRATLARNGAVVVTINYRLATLGFLAHPALTAESSKHASGNYGLLDQIAAIKWVQQNIAAFGGDANNVTIFGESAGAAMVGGLVGSPGAGVGRGVDCGTCASAALVPLNKTHARTAGLTKVRDMKLDIEQRAP